MRWAAPVQVCWRAGVQRGVQGGREGEARLKSAALTLLECNFTCVDRYGTGVIHSQPSSDTLPEPHPPHGPHPPQLASWAR